MVDVMGVHPAPVIAAREATALVARVQRPPDVRRDRSRPSTHGEGLAAGAQDRDHGCVAAQAARRLRRERRPVTHVDGALIVVDEGVQIDVDREQVAFGAAQGGRAAASAVSAIAQKASAFVGRGCSRWWSGSGVGRLRRPRGAVFRVRPRGAALRILTLSEQSVTRLMKRLEHQRPFLGGKAGAKAERAVLVPVVGQVAVLVSSLGLVLG